MDPITTPRQLISRYPYMFEGENLGISIARGWMPLFEQLCMAIDNLLGQHKSGFHFIQVKEKFGSARFYWSMNGRSPRLRINEISDQGINTELYRSNSEHQNENALSQKIEDLVDAATKKTQTMCVVCGQPALLDHGNFHLLMLCESHTQQRKCNDKLPIWFDAEDRP